MSVTFTKLFSSITESTVWCEPDRVRLVWITMLAMADKHGRVWASIPGLANRARVPVEDTRAAVQRFLEEDADSRTPDCEGRRIEPIDGGWRLLNYEKYRSVRDEEARRAYKAEKEAERRARLRGQNGQTWTENGHKAEAEAEAEAKQKTKAWSPSATQVDAFRNAWNTNCGDLPQLVKLSQARTKKLSVRIKDGLTLEQFTQAVGIAARTPFLRGETDRGWKCNFDFLIAKEENLLKVIEGAYGKPEAPKRVYRDVTDSPEAERWLSGGATSA